MINSALFDLDGTLVDSAPGVCWALNAALDEQSIASLTLANVKDMVGKGARHLVVKAMEHNGVDADDDLQALITTRFMEIYSDRPTKDTVVFDGAMSVLRGLRDRDVKLAICTNKPRKTTEPVLKAFGLEDFFSVVICGDDTAHRKPDPRHIWETLAALGGDKQSSVMVGDSENDILAARDAQVRSIAVSFGYCHVPMGELAPDALIDTFSAFDEALHKIFQ